MKSEFRQRAFLPLMIPIAVVGTIAVTVGLFAAIMLYLPQDVGNVVAMVLAAGILLAIALATSQDSLDPVKKAGVAIAAGVPLVFGGVAALGAFDFDPALLPANFEPHASFPAWAPTVVSTQPAAFDNESVTLPTAVPEGEENLVIVFDNQSGISHNLIAVSGDSRDADPFVSADGDPAATTTYTAGEEAVLFVPPEAGTYLFFCSIHDGMDGELIIEEGAVPSVDGEPVEGALAAGR